MIAQNAIVWSPGLMTSSLQSTETTHWRNDANQTGSQILQLLPAVSSTATKKLWWWSACSFAKRCQRDIPTNFQHTWEHAKTNEKWRTPKTQFQLVCWYAKKTQCWWTIDVHQCFFAVGCSNIVFFWRSHQVSASSCHTSNTVFWMHIVQILMQASQKQLSCWPLWLTNPNQVHWSCCQSRLQLSFLVLSKRHWSSSCQTAVQTVLGCTSMEEHSSSHPFSSSGSFTSSLNRTSVSVPLKASWW